MRLKEYFAVFILIFGFFSFFISTRELKRIFIGNLYFSYDCILNTEEKTVNGQSLLGLIEEGQKINILYGYHNCNAIKTNDVVAYRYAGNQNPIIKIIKAVPGDSFELIQIKNGWNIVVNGKIVKNSKNEPYILDKNGYLMLSLYEKDYKGIIPADSYLILGNVASGTLDSSRFGLISKSDILGKVVKINEGSSN